MEDYNNFSVTFASSRKNMKWEEIEYFMEIIKKTTGLNKPGVKILDIWCGSWRLVKYLENTFSIFEYLWVDASSWMINEAQKELPECNFQVLDMLNIDKLDTKFDIVFFIASFHHLDSQEKRLEVLKKIKNILNKDWLILMTNWNLFSKENSQKYSEILPWTWDFQIKIWKFNRYYHGFNLEELEELFIKSDLQISENRIWEWGRNIISILHI